MEMIYVIGVSAATSLATSWAFHAFKGWLRKRNLAELVATVTITKEEAERDGYTRGVELGAMRLAATPVSPVKAA